MEGGPQGTTGGQPGKGGHTARRQSAQMEVAGAPPGSAGPRGQPCPSHLLRRPWGARWSSSSPGSRRSGAWGQPAQGCGGRQSCRWSCAVGGDSKSVAAPVVSQVPHPAFPPRALGPWTLRVPPTSLAQTTASESWTPGPSPEQVGKGAVHQRAPPRPVRSVKGTGSRAPPTLPPPSWPVWGVGCPTGRALRTPQTTGSGISLSRISTAERGRLHPLCRRSARGVTVGGRHGERGAHRSSRQDLERQASCQMHKNL